MGGKGGVGALTKRQRCRGGRRGGAEGGGRGAPAGGAACRRWGRRATGWRGEAPSGHAGRGKTGRKLDEVAVESADHGPTFWAGGPPLFSLFTWDSRRRAISRRSLASGEPEPTVGASPPLTAQAPRQPHHHPSQAASTSPRRPASPPPRRRWMLRPAVSPLPSLAHPPRPPSPPPSPRTSLGPFHFTWPGWCGPRIDGHGVGRVCPLLRRRAGVPPGRPLGGASRPRLPATTGVGGGAAGFTLAPRAVPLPRYHFPPLHGHGRDGY